MMNLNILFLAVAALLSFTQCSNHSGNEISNADTRAKVISKLMENNAYMQEVMAAMKTKHGEVIVSTSFIMMKDDKATVTKMMGNMMDICMRDTALCKLMMGKTMEMCDMDKDKCKMLMASMQEHPTVMKSMKDMGMCDMKAMNLK